MGWLGGDLHKYMLYKDQLKDCYLSRFHDCQMDLRADPDDTITCCWAAWRRAFWGGCCLPADSWLVCRGELQVKGTTKDGALGKMEYSSYQEDLEKFSRLLETRCPEIQVLLLCVLQIMSAPNCTGPWPWVCPVVAQGMRTGTPVSEAQFSN